MIRPPVVVVGLDCPTGLQTARVFANRGIEVIGIAADPGHACARTRACRQLVRAGSESEEVAQALKRIGAERSDRPVVVPCTDQAVIGIARHRQDLAERFRVAVPSLEVIELLLDKARFAEFAARHGLPVPDTHVIRGPSDVPDVAELVEYPCVLKPALKSPRWDAQASAKAFVASSPAELRALHARASEWADVFVVQRWIEGDDTQHYTCDCYLDRDGRPLVTFTSRKLRQWPPVVGQGSLSVEHRNDVVRDEAIRTFRCAGHHGQAYLEMKYDAACGRHLIIEANVGRPTGRSATAEKAGVELLMTLYSDLVGLELPARRTQHFRGTKWIHLRRDLQASWNLWTSRRIGVRELLRSWRGPTAFALLSLRDPLPFLFDFDYALGATFRRRGRKRTGVDAPAPGPASNRAGEPGGRPPRPADGAADPEPRAHGPRERAERGSDRSVQEHRAIPSLARAPTVEFDVHGLFGVRIRDAHPSDVAAVERDLGPPSPLRGTDPDVIVCFVDDLCPPPLTMIGDGTAAYGRDGVYFLDRPGGTPVARVERGSRLGAALIVCRSGVSRVPTLAAALDLGALAKGWVGLHASAWVAGGCGVLAAGWPGSGKTGALLAACERGARPVGDDRIYLSADGTRMAGLGRSLVGRDWHLAQLSAPTTGAHPVRRSLSRAGPAVSRLTERVSGTGRWGRLPRKLTRGLRRALELEIPARRLSLGDGTHAAVRPDVLVLLETHRDSVIRARPIDARAAADRLAHQTEAELLPALRTHLAFGYALDAHGWRGFRDVPGRIGSLLSSATRELRCFRVRHPYPCSLEHLHEVIATLAAEAPTRTNGRRSLGPLASLPEELREVGR